MWPFREPEHESEWNAMLRELWREGDGKHLRWVAVIEGNPAPAEKLLDSEC